MNTKQKYVRLKAFEEIVIFPEVMQHKEFKSFNIESAGFCYVNGDKKTVECFGESVSLGLKSNPEEDSLIATKQIFGIEPMEALQKRIKEMIKCDDCGHVSHISMVIDQWVKIENKTYCTNCKLKHEGK